ncbi:ABC transporter ATP-binding protein [Skermanella stibiiresistens SB22]|uniref:ABC transporter ATP-binding protein n=1 Tax=Skermanella stibiiresistens SB22 TaxID=1385369 RepID=W9GYN8_9PROT|nr:ABC transporter permease [Skermanella stibiiresistens]EWY37562.1 ABC transporter ATP-binding protein [Skermanella stibiiresistens SB22]
MRPLIRNEWFVRVAAPLLVGALVLAVWQLACQTYEVPAYLFPTPTDIAAKLASDLPGLLGALWSTLKVTFMAFAIAVIAGTALAFLFTQSRIIEFSLLPYAVILQVTPIAAVAPLIIILVKDTTAALTICAAVIAIFPIISNTTIGLKSVDPSLANYFRMNKAGRLQTLVRLRIPSALPFFLAGLRISSGLALIGAVVAEFVAGTGGRSAGLAYEILQSSFQLDIPRMFAALFLITATGVILFLAMAGLSNLLLGHWHESALKVEQ